MRRPLSEHTQHPWKVREITHDFELDEVWEFPILADEQRGENFRTFCKICSKSMSKSLSGPAKWLFALRIVLGRLGLDGPVNQLPIPGSTELSLSERLSEKDRNRSKPQRMDGAIPFRVVYEYDNEILVEISNATVHAALHYGWVHKHGTCYSPLIAVYVKPRGLWGKIYMHLIHPFRIYVIYPAMMKAAMENWEAWRRETSG